MEVKLVTLADYARKWRINRTTVFELIKRGDLEKYFIPNKKNPLVNLNQKPEVQKYAGKRKRRIA